MIGHIFYIRSINLEFCKNQDIFIMVFMSLTFSHLEKNGQKVKKTEKKGDM